jgi:hypothetical protein
MTHKTLTPTYRNLYPSGYRFVWVRVRVALEYPRVTCYNPYVIYHIFAKFNFYSFYYFPTSLRFFRLLPFLYKVGGTRNQPPYVIVLYKRQDAQNVGFKKKKKKKKGKD